MVFKKLMIGAAAVTVASGFVFGRDLFSYLRTGASSVRSAIKAEVPIEFEMQRARNLVEHLVPDIRQCMHVVAEQQVDIEHRDQALAAKLKNLDEQKQALLSLRSDLGSGRSVFTYASRSYTSEEVQRDLACRFERFKAAEESLAADQKILAARKQHLTANQDKLNGMMQAKKDLEVKLEQLQARLETIRAAETVSTLAIDDSQLSQAKQLIGELNKQLDVKQKMLDAEGKFSGLIPTQDVTPPSPVPSDITNQIDAYFAPSNEAASVVQGR